MKNKFRQSVVGECAIVVIANILNDDRVIVKCDSSNGTTAMVQRHILEAHSDYTFRGVYEVKKPVKDYTPVFEIDNDFKDKKEYNKDHYILYLAGLQEEGKKGHAIMVIKENHNKTLTILDPLKEKCEKVHQFHFFEEYPCVSLDVVMSKQGDTMFFYESFIKHLID
jgi:hypothetical protein